MSTKMRMRLAAPSMPILRFLARTPLERALDRLKQALLGDRLREKAVGAAPHSTLAQVHIAVAGQKNYRQSAACMREILLQLDAAHARHIDVEQYATRRV